jgi:hypothetical protein
VVVGLGLAAGCAPHPVSRVTTAPSDVSSPTVPEPGLEAGLPPVISGRPDAAIADAPADAPSDLAGPPRDLRPPADGPLAPPDVAADRPPVADTAPPDLAPIRDAATADGPRPAVLYVVNNTTVTGTAKVLSDHLATLGLTVTRTADENATTAGANGKALVIISAGVASAMVGNKYRDVAVPVICLETNVLSNMRMTGGADADHGTTSTTQISIVDPVHPLAAGLSGMVTVFSAAAPVEWGVPGAGAARVATVVGDATHAVIYGYDKGAMLLGNVPAPARRIGIFLDDSGGTGALTADGFKLLDAAVGWALSP